MTHLANLQRDQFHLNLSGSPLTYSAAPSAIGSTINANTSGIVALDFDVKHTFDSTSNVAGDWSAFGILMQQPTTLDEWESYRVKAYCSGVEERFCIIGNGPETPTGNNDPIINVHAFPMVSGVFDEVVRHTQPNLALPLFFGIAVGQALNALSVGIISAQRLSIASPTYTSTTS